MLLEMKDILCDVKKELLFQNGLKTIDEREIAKQVIQKTVNKCWVIEVLFSYGKVLDI